MHMCVQQYNVIKEDEKLVTKRKRVNENEAIHDEDTFNIVKEHIEYIIIT